MPRGPVKKLPWTVYETQGDEPWCASITTTNIIRNTTNRSMTSSQMRTWLGNQGGLTQNQVIYYLNSKLGITNILQLTSGKPTQSTIENEIDLGRAIYASFRDESGGHAMAIIGYNTIAGAYHIHNPWYPYTETITVAGVYVGGGHRYQWTGGALFNIKG